MITITKTPEKCSHLGLQIIRFLIKGKRIDAELVMKHPLAIYPLMQFTYLRDALKYGRSRSFLVTACFSFMIIFNRSRRRMFRARVLDAVPRITR